MAGPDDMHAKMSAEKPIAEFWYAIKPQDANILWLREIYVDPFVTGDIWLVRGSEKDLVVDTGTGIVPLAPVIEALCAKPVIAVAMNCYYDHAGGWHGFAERACHPLDAAALADPSDKTSFASEYLSDEMLSALPRPGYSTADYRMFGAAPTRLLEDGDIIDLGDRVVKVLHLPGRTPGGLGLWEAETGSLFTGDMLYDDPAGIDWTPDDPTAYAASLRRLRALTVSWVHGGHYGRFDGKRMTALIDEQLAGLSGS